jgi:hypothetical protein
MERDSFISTPVEGNVRKTASSENQNLSLWEDASPAIPALGTSRLNWSYSRREAVDHCLRRYFYQYYASCSPDASLREQVKRPKEIKNHHLRVGELVHLAISTYFKKLKQGKDLPSSWRQSWVRKIFAEDQAYSKLIKSGGPSSTEKYPPTILDEIVFDVAEGDQLLEQAAEQLGAAIQTFFTSNALQEFRALGAKPHSLIEHKMSLDGYKAPVSGKIDLVVHEGISATIVDWKLGVASDGGAESLQLASYGLWANATYALPAEQIHIAKAHLADGSAVDFKADNGSFANARARIQQDLERMTILHTYGQAGIIDVFTPSPHLKMCRLCPFRRICPEGEENHA